MDNIMANLTAIITVIAGLFVVKKITGFIFKLIFGAVLVGFLYYVYNGGSLDAVNEFINSVM